MKTIFFLTSIILISSCSYRPQFNKVSDFGVVYGDDNRSESSIDQIIEHNPDLSYDEANALLEMSKATAGMVDLGMDLSKNFDGSYNSTKKLRTLAERKNLCSGENFSDEYTFPVCSGFLVGPDLLATAGHCVNREDFKQKAWIFGYDYKFANNSNPTFSPNQIYTVKEVILWEKNIYSLKDFALVRLDRPVLNVKPLKIRMAGKATKGERLAIIGHPSGLTTKISAEASILDDSEENRLKTNLDSFAGNSGSAVINLKTGVVEGILVSGADDYIEKETNGTNDDDGYCQIVSMRKEEEGEEYITRISLLSSAIH